MDKKEANEPRIVASLIGVLVQHNCSVAQAEQLCSKAINSFKERSFHVTN